ncbi:MAG TPA: M14-type cytosolic carboxypeptidase [Planctomycetota bacterium]|nr:M14-type cytosolic carboxypeptidase [Planctomycetota bacterium]
MSVRSSTSRAAKQSAGDGNLAVSAAAEFPGSNGVEFERMAPDRLRFQMIKHSSPAVLWWQFRALVPVGRRVTFELVNTADTLGRASGWSFVRPVYSYDRKRWYRLVAEDCRFDAERERFVFSGVFSRPDVYLAQAYPYHQVELDCLQAELKKSPLFRGGFAGRTEQGRPYPLWTLMPRGKTAGRGRKLLGVMLTARLHAGESHGSYALDGMLQEIAFSRSAGMRWLRRHAAFLIAPMADYDGVMEGMFGKDRSPIDFNRDWSADPVRPEVRRLQVEAEAWARRTRFAAYFDFHCPCLPDVPHLYGAAPGMTTQRLKVAEQEFARNLERLSPAGAPFYYRDLLYPGYQGATAEVVASRYMTTVHGVLGLTPEVAYHPTRRTARDEDKRGPVVEIPALRKLGAAHAHALANLLQRHEPEIRSHTRAFYDPAEALLGPVVSRKDSRFQRWGLLGGEMAQFGERELSPAEWSNLRQGGQVATTALTLAARAGQPAFFLTETVSVSRALDGPHSGLKVRARVRGVRSNAPKKGAVPRGLLVHVFYYDKKGARFGRLFGSELQELPLSAAWRRFAPKLAPPAGAVTARLAIRCEVEKGVVEILPEENNPTKARQQNGKMKK